MTKQLPWFRSALDSLVIVGSILLAFGLQAGWEHRADREEEARLLNSLLNEFRANDSLLTASVQYQVGIQNSARALLGAAADPAQLLSKDSVDTLIGGVSWYATSSRFETAAVDAVVLGGKLAILSNEDLRTQLTAWLRRLEGVEATVLQDHENYFHVWLPFLRTNAYLPQISNAIKNQPGTGEPYYGAQAPVHPDPVDHRAVLSNREFQNILMQKSWVADDILDQYRLLEPSLRRIVEELAIAVRD